MLFITFIVAAACLLGLELAHAQFASAPKFYQCISSKKLGGASCRLNSSLTSATGMSQGACQVACEHGNIWPKPTGSMVVSSSLEVVNWKTVRCELSSSSTSSSSLATLQQAACSNFIESIQYLVPSSSPSSTSEGKNVVVSFDFSSDVSVASVDNDESYITVFSTDKDTVFVKVSGQTFFGARHGLETASQLFRWDDLKQFMVTATSASISDKPSFKYRGVMIDTSRQFLSVGKIKETIRAMGYNKMNVLHWHLTDTASFPIYMKDEPLMTYTGAYSSDQIYDEAIVSDVSSFAASYGIMIIPEIDSPAHMGMGWTGHDPSLGDLVLCADNNGNGGEQWNIDSLEPPSGQLNIVNENAYKILGNIYRNVISAFGKEGGYFHLGGDEVIVGSDDGRGCYNKSNLAKPIIDYINENGLDRNNENTFYDLLENFTYRATKLVTDAYGSDFKKLHVWGGGGLDQSGIAYNIVARPEVTQVLPPDQFTIQVWDETNGSIVPSLISKGYEIILSNTDYVYLDCGNAGFTNPGGYWCQPYSEWYHIYEYINNVKSLWKLSEKETAQIKGSETLAWGEMIDDNNLSQKLWPRSAALAEALWTDPSNTWYDADPRMILWRNTLKQRGIWAEALRPQWCAQREAHACTLREGTPER